MKIRESRKWVGTEESGHLKILQWNILAQALAGKDAGFPCSEEFLEFDYRFSRIIQVSMYEVLYKVLMKIYMYQS